VDLPLDHGLDWLRQRDAPVADGDFHWDLPFSGGVREGDAVAAKR
jgi:hypothetical protein